MRPFMSNQAAYLIDEVDAVLELCGIRCPNLEHQARKVFDEKNELSPPQHSHQKNE
jgi:hypothetical protein